ncbi:MAG: hypothetical protein JRG96_15930 [Deltaproteobacteria bacterium]|nr:hypothetical protein [Deltaproteobacteria bacterium]MBW2417906.1 hypothetical protein [Deltaproteobacteria bacterium]
MTAAAAATPARRGDRDPTLWLLLGLVLAVNVVSMPAYRYDGDPIAWEVEADYLTRWGRLGAPAAVAERVGGHTPYFVFNPESGRHYSKYGIANTLLYSIPLFLERHLAGVDVRLVPDDAFGKPGLPYTQTRRVLTLNLFNLALSLLLAATLYRLAALYTESRPTRLLFVLSCFYSTYLWNYLRGQSSQIYQCLFFSFSYYQLLLAQRSALATRSTGAPGPLPLRPLALSTLALGALCLVKTAYLPLLAVHGSAALALGTTGPADLRGKVGALLRGRLGSYAVGLVLPALACLVLLLAVNDLKFGSPLRLGYEGNPNLWGGKLYESIPSYLFHPRFSIFVHFPLLVIALFGLRSFVSRHHWDLALVWSHFLVMFAINSNYLHWDGEAAFGARYLLFALPTLSLPAIAVFDRIALRRSQTSARIAAAAIAILLLTSAWLQTRQNALEFHVYYRLRPIFFHGVTRSPEVWSYFQRNNQALVVSDFERYRDGGPPPLPMEVARGRLGPAEYAELEARIRTFLGSNYYFW